ncbi:MAG: patatin-like phospholipase family protein [Betaproteobacteria bacterium]
MHISLALQGGGSHGAFTWGALDRLLAHDGLDLEGVSGASAGAINAVVLAHGWTTGGAAGARQALRRFWESLPRTAPASPLLYLAHFYSPYQLNPFNLNPLRELLAEQVDFERLRSDCRLKLFVAATRVDTGMPRLFTTQELSIDAVLASCCLPQLQHSVRIDGVDYWDGGLTANPPVRPLIYQCSAPDVVAVLLNPGRRAELPFTADGIRERLAEMSFTSALYAELEGIELAKQAAERSALAFGMLERRLKRLRLHFIDSPELMARLEPASRLDTTPAFLHALCDEGRESAARWLQGRANAANAPGTIFWPTRAQAPRP